MKVIPKRHINLLLTHVQFFKKTVGSNETMNVLHHELSFTLPPVHEQFLAEANGVIPKGAKEVNIIKITCIWQQLTWHIREE